MTSKTTKIAANCDPEACKGRKLKTYKVVMVRHGESEWNESNRFTGWYDALLSKKGKGEAQRAGQALKDANYKFDIAFCSVLTRAKETLNLILKEIGNTDICIQHSWRLNERHYGSLTGLNKAETAEKFGEDQVKIWRRSFNIPPPPMEESHQFYDTIVKDPRYEKEPPLSEFPMAESLELTIKRTLPYWNNTIVPTIKSGKAVLIAAHGNSLRGIVKHLQGISDEDIIELNLPTGIPFYYELDNEMKPKGPMQFLGDPETVAKAMADVANQGKVQK